MNNNIKINMYVKCKYKYQICILKAISTISVDVKLGVPIQAKAIVPLPPILKESLPLLDNGVESKIPYISSP